MVGWLWFSLLVLALDQGSKWLVQTTLEAYQPYVVTSFLNWTLMYNNGAAFNFLSDAGGWQRWFFVVVALGMSLVLCIWLLRLKAGEGWLAAGLSLIVGGALGNLVDRALLGHVVDFIQVSIPAIRLAIFNPWPAFNIADSAIFLGVAILLIMGLRSEDGTRTDEA